MKKLWVSFLIIIFLNTRLYSAGSGYLALPGSGFPKIPFEISEFVRNTLESNSFNWEELESNIRLSGFNPHDLLCYQWFNAVTLPERSKVPGKEQERLVLFFLNNPTLFVSTAGPESVQLDDTLMHALINAYQNSSIVEHRLLYKKWIAWLLQKMHAFKASCHRPCGHDRSLGFCLVDDALGRTILDLVAHDDDLLSFLVS